MEISDPQREADLFTDDNNDFLHSLEAQLIPAVVGSISAVSSIFVIYFILFSQSKLRSPYHRIIFFMSLWDVVTSTAIALTTIPMPSSSDMNINNNNVYEHPLEGRSYGTAATCQVQGFAILVGRVFEICSIVTLNIFYICSIRYGMSDKTVKRRLLPMMLIIACVAATAAIFGATALMKIKNPMHPHVSPPICSPLKTGGNRSTFMIVRIIGASSIFLLIIVSMVLVARTIFLTNDLNATKEDGTTGNENIGIDIDIDIGNVDREGSNHENPNHENPNNESSNDKSSNHEGPNHECNDFDESEAAKVKSNYDGDEDYGRIREKSKNVDRRKIIFRQVLMYIGVFSMSCIFPLVNEIFVVATGDTPVVLYVIISATVPMLGFMNALIFGYHKVYILRRAHPNFTLWKALKIVILLPSSVPEILLARIDIVTKDANGNGNDDDDDAEGGEDRDEDPRFSLPSDLASPESPSFNVSFVLDHVIIEDPKNENKDAHVRNFNKKQLTIGGIKRRGKGILSTQ